MATDSPKPAPLSLETAILTPHPPLLTRAEIPDLKSGQLSLITQNLREQQRIVRRAILSQASALIAAVPPPAAPANPPDAWAANERYRALQARQPAEDPAVAPRARTPLEEGEVADGHEAEGAEGVLRIAREAEDMMARYDKQMMETLAVYEGSLRRHLGDQEGLGIGPGGAGGRAKEAGDVDAPTPGERVRRASTGALKRTGDEVGTSDSTRDPRRRRGG